MKSSSWAYPTAVLSLYGFFANCRVAEPFLTPYLIGPHKNISEEVVRMADIYCIYILYIMWIYGTETGIQNIFSGTCFQQVTNYLFPVWTYSYLAFLFPIFLLTDFMRYKPLIMTQGFFLVTNYILLCFAPGLPAMIFLQVQ